MKISVVLVTRADLVAKFPRVPESISSSLEGYLQEQHDKGLSLVAFSETAQAFRCVFARTNTAENKKDATK